MSAVCRYVNRDELHALPSEVPGSPTRVAAFQVGKITLEFEVSAVKTA